MKLLAIAALLGLAGCSQEPEPARETRVSSVNVAYHDGEGGEAKSYAAALASHEDFCRASGKFAICMDRYRDPIREHGRFAISYTPAI